MTPDTDLPDWFFWTGVVLVVLNAATAFVVSTAFQTTISFGYSAIISFLLYDSLEK